VCANGYKQITAKDTGFELWEQLCSQQTLLMKIANDSDFTVNSSCTIYKFMAKILKLYSEDKFVMGWLQVQETSFAQLRNLQFQAL
jgi:hypothetical protein